MSERHEFDTKLGPEGRVLIPAEVRKAMGVGAGDRVRIILDDDGVRMIAARSMALSLWDNNRGDESDDSVADVRRSRTADIELGEPHRAPGEVAEDYRTEDEIAEDLFASLGLDL